MRLLPRWMPWALVLFLLVAAFVFGTQRVLAGNPNALWHILHDRCVPDQQAQHRPAPCVFVDLDAGYVVLKDRVGPLQFLLLPVNRIGGIESPALLAPIAPHWFVLAWQARRFMAARYGHEIAARDEIIAINSAHARSQNQLHIHISCISPTVRKALDDRAAAIGTAWQPLPAALDGDPYLARRISRATLNRDGAFRTLAALADARAHMGDYGLAMTTLPGTPEFVLLATRSDRLHNHWGSAEGLADHDCEILGLTPHQRQSLHAAGDRARP